MPHHTRIRTWFLSPNCVPICWIFWEAEILFLSFFNELFHYHLLDVAVISHKGLLLSRWSKGPNIVMLSRLSQLAVLVLVLYLNLYTLYLYLYLYTSGRCTREVYRASQLLLWNFGEWRGWKSLGLIVCVKNSISTSEPFLMIPRLFDGGLMNGSSCTLEISKFIRNNFPMV